MNIVTKKKSFRLVEESSSSQTPSSDYNKTSKAISARDQTINVPSPTSESDEMKRAIAKKLIERYFYQLSDGCGKPNCANKNCASSGSVEALSPNQAAARAIQLYSQEAELCELHPAKVAKTQDCKSNLDDGSGYVICVLFNFFLLFSPSLHSQLCFETLTLVVDRSYCHHFYTLSLLESNFASPNYVNFT